VADNLAMDLHTTVTEFFHGQVTDALRAQDVQVTQPTEFYLVNLLSEFTAMPVSEEPLALKLVRVQESSATDKKVKGLKEIGDHSLVVTGLFSDSLSRKLVDVNYYIAMGTNAYGQLAGLIASTRGSTSAFFQAVYEELAAKFARFVEVLQEIRRNTHLVGGGNIIGLYEAYLKSGDEWLARRLREAGVLLIKGPAS
jgi:hypothetical protein